MRVKQLATDWFIISDVINDRLCECEYMEYNRDEAIDLFKQKFEQDYELQHENESDTW